MNVYKKFSRNCLPDAWNHARVWHLAEMSLCLFLGTASAGGGPFAQIQSRGSNSAVDVRLYGARGDGKTDDTAAISRAISVAHDNRKSVYFPASKASYIYSACIRLDGVALYGDGDGSLLEAIDPRASAIILTGNSPSVGRLRIISPLAVKIGRQILPQTGGIMIDGADGFCVESVNIDTTASVGIISLGGHGKPFQPAIIQNCRVANTLADGIHLTNKSAYVEVLNNNVRNSGDDMFAVVSYTRDGDRCHDIRIEGNSGEGQSADGRGISVVGGYSVQIIKNTITRCRGAGIYLDSDLVRDSSGKLLYKMLGDDDIEVRDNTLTDLASTVYHGGINIAGRPADFADPGDHDYGDQIIRNIRIIGNCITNAHHSGISMQDYFQDVYLENNTIRQVSEEGLEIFGGADLFVGDQTGNLFENVGRHGIYVGINNVLTHPLSGHLTIRNNKFWDTNRAETRALPILSIIRQPGLIADIGDNDFRPSASSLTSLPYVDFVSP